MPLTLEEYRQQVRDTVPCTYEECLADVGNSCGIRMTDGSFEYKVYVHDDRSVAYHNHIIKLATELMKHIKY